jgi:hypothetical protein
MSPELTAAIIGGFIGGILGVVGTLISSYYGPRKIEEYREKRKEEREYGPQKSFLSKCLRTTDFLMAVQLIYFVV